MLPDAQFQSSSFALQPGDTLVLFSDGVTEAMDPEVKGFGLGRLREVLAGRAGASLDDLQSPVLAVLKVFTRGAEQAGDITLLLVPY